MTRRFALAFPLLVGLVTMLFVWIIVYEPGVPESAQRELDGYLAAQQRPMQVVEIRRATRPESFSAEISAGAYGMSVHYQTLDEPPGQRVASSIPRPDSRRPVPYPPQQVWCVLVEQGEGAAPRVLFLALHQDLYNADWLVHESRPAPIDSDAGELLAAMGCMTP